MVRPTTLSPRSCSSAATVELSTPPLMATAIVPLVCPLFMEILRASAGACLFAREGRKLAQALDNAGKHANGIFDLLGGGAAADADPQARARLQRREADGGQHVRRLNRSRRAGGAGAAGDALQVERNDEGLAPGAKKTDIGSVRHAPLHVAVQARLRHRR